MLNRTRSWLKVHRPRSRSGAAGPHGETALSAERLNRMYGALKRRLSDQIEDVLEEACMIGDLQTAEELLLVLDFMATRLPRSSGAERRVRSPRIDQLRGEVARQREARAARAFRHPGTAAGA